MKNANESREQEINTILRIIASMLEDACLTLCIEKRNGEPVLAVKDNETGNKYGIIETLAR